MVASLGRVKYVPGKDYNIRELEDLIRQQGWSIETKGADGHRICRKNGERPFQLPTNPKKGTKQWILKLIGLKG